MRGLEKGGGGGRMEQEGMIKVKMEMRNIRRNEEDAQE
jgi:hypothetical protein